ncbi:hypothetical protein BT96DRAFT_984887 [Gymnopus androsaceus JB14]|uniref:Zn(2)-C6 fungal-type domain-containing protein n=1 Tax=Gymnopus androsaceus JB14 TaxID=1447944 RepID=A0A6A4IEV1_9AGAR|nr:hypothetical protein BT96DRAFT_984887 [Gymnopus androsaceus JB14]
MSSSSYNEAASLRRGQACISCRRRKMRCDGAKPICNQCLRRGRPEDCEYTDGHGPTLTETLENNITQLQRRIYELENRSHGNSRDSVLLNQPYSSRSNIPAGAAASSEPPTSLIQPIVDKFLEHGDAFGFFLSPSNFRASVVLPYAIGHHWRPSESLLTTVYFLGCLFSDDPIWNSRSQGYLSSALQYVSIGKLVEGRYHITAAMSIGVGSGLNKIRSPEMLLMHGNGDGTFPQAGSAVDVGERVIGWWVTVSFNQCWAAAFEVNSYNDAIITGSETPWPLTLEYYAQGHLSHVQPSLTVASYLNGTIQDVTNSSSYLELFAKASLLWKQAHLVKEAAATGSNIGPSFEITRNRINELLVILANSGNPNGRNLLPWCIAHAALISLNGMRSPTATSVHSLRSSSLAILEEIRKIVPQRVKHLSPIITMIWALANRTLLNVLRTTSGGESRNLIASIRIGVSAMEQFRSSWSSLTS